MRDIERIRSYWFDQPRTHDKAVNDVGALLVEIDRLRDLNARLREAHEVAIDAFIANPVEVAEQYQRSKDVAERAMKDPAFVARIEQALLEKRSPWEFPE